MRNDMIGKVVSEEEVSKDLGFKNVFEFRRWETDVGKENEELKYKLKREKEESEGFRNIGRKMQWLLEKVGKKLENCRTQDNDLIKCLKAIKVICGKEVDWENELEVFWKEMEK